MFFSDISPAPNFPVYFSHVFSNVFPAPNFLIPGVAAAGLVGNFLSIVILSRYKQDHNKSMQVHNKSTQDHKKSTLQNLPKTVPGKLSSM